jgi:predicted DNA-binding transcriptional regulator YafY
MLGNKKFQRIQNILKILYNDSGKFTIAELAIKLGVNRTTVWRDIQDLSLDYNIQVIDGLVYLKGNINLIHLDLTWNETMMLYLALRLFTKWRDRKNHHASLVLQKIASQIKAVNSHEYFKKLFRTVAKSIDELKREDDQSQMRILEIINQAQLKRCQLRITYFSRHASKEETFHFNPWFLEPYLVGHSIHLIGSIVGETKPRILKIERIKSITLSNQKLELPEELYPDSLFAFSWGVWVSDKQPQTVTLKFLPEIAERVLENRWHLSEKIQKLKDGSLIWSALISEPLEMVPWILGWGKYCQVIRPKELQMEVENQRG